MFIEFLKLRQLDPKEGGSGGNNDFVPLGDIDAEEEVITDPAKKPADLDAAASEQEKKEAEAKLAEEAEAKRLEAEEAEKKKKAEEASNEGGEGDEEGEGSFWDDVDKLRGEALEVDFGDVEPDTPEGALIYEKAARLDELNKFEQYLEENHPRAYAYLTHIMDGGKEEDFFKTAGDPATLPTEAELETNVDIQKDIITRNLKAKGMGDKVISTVIKTAVTDDELEEMAKTALKEESDKQAAAIQAVKTQSENSVKERQKQIDQMSKYVSEVTALGKLDNITIPEKDRAPFAKVITESIRYENGKFLMVTEINNDTAIQAFKEKFFSYKKGNLDDLIVKTARTENTKRLQRSIPAGNKKPLGNGQRADSSFVALGEMED